MSFFLHRQLRRLASGILLLGLLPAPALSESPAPYFCQIPASEQKGAVLFIHGLNHSPSTLEPLRRLVRTIDFASCQLRLSGHLEHTHADDPKLDTWRKEVSAGVQSIHTTFPNIPLVGFGYSLGGALLLDAAELNTQFDALILIAPAVRLRWRTQLLTALLPFRHAGFSLPSMAPEQYRVHSSTSLQMYHATFDVVAALNANPPPLALKQTPILLILAEDDEVVDSPEVADFFTSNKFSAITNLRVVPEPLLKHSFNHLIVDENTLGAEEWRRVSNAISGFLRASFVNPP